ncbi:unnamed protein product, partial [Amoebophrya sp. A25]|eukprot:GSA25T00017275001.1
MTGNSDDPMIEGMWEGKGIDRILQKSTLEKIVQQLTAQGKELNGLVGKKARE